MKTGALVLASVILFGLPVPGVKGDCGANTVRLENISGTINYAERGNGRCYKWQFPVDLADDYALILNLYNVKMTGGGDCHGGLFLPWSADGSCGWNAPTCRVSFTRAFATKCNLEHMKHGFLGIDGCTDPWWVVPERLQNFIKIEEENGNPRSFSLNYSILGCKLPDTTAVYTTQVQTTTDQSSADTSTSNTALPTAENFREQSSDVYIALAASLGLLLLIACVVIIILIKRYRLLASGRKSAGRMHFQNDHEGGNGAIYDVAENVEHEGNAAYAEVSAQRHVVPAPGAIAGGSGAVGSIGGPREAENAAVGPELYATVNKNK